MLFITASCLDCVYQIAGQCRRNPPSASADTIPPHGYPVVTPTTPACGEYDVQETTQGDTSDPVLDVDLDVTVDL